MIQLQISILNPIEMRILDFMAINLWSLQRGPTSSPAGGQIKKHSRPSFMETAWES